MLKITYNQKEDAIVSQWSGGKTSEIYIYPVDGNYVEREFDFRISTATVEVGKTDFTVLPGFNRIIMTLTNPIILSHSSHKQKELLPFEPYYFSGDIETQSVGICEDFNVIFRDDLIATVNVFKGDEQKLDLICNKKYIFYVLDKVSIQIIEKDKLVDTACLGKGDSLVLEGITEKTVFSLISNTVEDSPSVILSSICI